jgi:hypothetical protein
VWQKAAPAEGLRRQAETTEREALITRPARCDSDSYCQRQAPQAVGSGYGLCSPKTPGVARRETGHELAAIVLTPLSQEATDDYWIR